MPGKVVAMQKLRLRDPSMVQLSRNEVTNMGVPISWNLHPWLPGSLKAHTVNREKSKAGKGRRDQSIIDQPKSIDN